MKRLLLKYAALLVASFVRCMACSEGRLGDFERFRANEYRSRPIFGGRRSPKFCSQSQSVAGPSVSLSLSCQDASGWASVSASINGFDLNDVTGEVWLSIDAHNSPIPGYVNNASASVQLTANGFLYIAAPSSTVDITFNAIECLGCSAGWTMTVTGIGGSAFNNLTTNTQIPYSLDWNESVFDFYQVDNFIWQDLFSCDLRLAAVKDHASGTVLDSAQIRFSDTAVPEPGAGTFCGIGVALLACSKRRFARRR